MIVKIMIYPKKLPCYNYHSKTNTKNKNGGNNMNVKKLLCSLAAAAVAVSMMAVNVFAVTVDLDSEYPGPWKAGKCIPKADLEALGGDVKVVLTVEIKEPLVGEHLHHLRPIDHDTSWVGFTTSLQSDTAYAMESDGNFVLADGQTTVEFIIPADIISSLADGGLGFMVCNVIVKSADISKADAPQGAIKLVTKEEGEQITLGTYGAESAETEAAPEETTAAPEETAAASEEPVAVPADENEEDIAVDDIDEDEVSAPAETEAPAAEPAPVEISAPAADTAVTTPAATGNASAAVMISVMAAAGAAAIAAKKRK